MTTVEPSHAWQTKEMWQLCTAISSLRNENEAAAFLRDLCTLAEIDAMAHRWQVVRLLDEGLPYLEINRRTHASTTTITRVAHWLRHGEGGYKLVLDRQRRGGKTKTA